MGLGKHLRALQMRRKTVSTQLCNKLPEREGFHHVPVTTGSKTNTFCPEGSKREQDLLRRSSGDRSTGNTTLYSMKRSPFVPLRPNDGIPFPLINCTKPRDEHAMVYVSEPSFTSQRRRVTELTWLRNTRPLQRVIGPVQQSDVSLKSEQCLKQTNW